MQIDNDSVFLPIYSLQIVVELKLIPILFLNKAIFFIVTVIKEVEGESDQNESILSRWS